MRGRRWTCTLVAVAVLVRAVTAGAAAPGADYVDEARTLYRTATCGSTGDRPRELPAAVVDAHCRQLAKDYAAYRAKWLDEAVPYLARLVPSDVPTTVVYPFGGGDLVTALATFPDATDFTTISLEPAGDVRKVDRLSAREWEQVLAMTRATLGVLFAKAYNTSKTLRTVRSPLPEELVDTMAALVLFGYEPVALRYFAIEPDGTLRHLEPDARGALDTSNMELAFRKANDAAAPVKILRHVAANLNDRHLRDDPRVLAYLAAKGQIAAMTKAAIHLLGSDDFSLLRGVLSTHVTWMISDDTGFLPRHARAAGFVQEGHGVYRGPSRYGTVEPGDAEQLKRLFAHDEKLPFFAYGYTDASGHGHLIVTRKASN
ncbi:hypothetical protein K2Z84_33705 [Candidatus Binatia bacterium]|nr:hypothetical protein [Candidatus Binatia bacterium]